MCINIARDVKKKDVSTTKIKINIKLLKLKLSCKIEKLLQLVYYNRSFKF